MLKKIFSLLLVVFSFTLFTNVYAKEYVKTSDSSKTYKIVDDKEILTEEEALKILDQMKPIASNGNVILRITGDQIEYDALQDAADNYFNSWKTENDNYLMIYLNINNEIKVFNNVAIRNKGFSYTDEQLMNIVWEVTPSFRDGKNVDGIIGIFDRFNNLTEGSSINTTGTGNYKLIIEDDANLLSEEEIVKLKEDMLPLTEFGHAIFKTIDNNTYTSTEDFAKKYYYEHFGNENGSMLLIDMDNRIVYICSGGTNYDILSHGKAEVITDNIYRYLTNGEYYEGASQAFKQMNQLLSGYKIAEPMRYASNVVISLVVAFFINFIIIMITCSPKKASSKAAEFGVEMAVAVNSFKALSNGTHRVYSPVSESSGSSGGHSGGHSGGGFSGGHSGGGGGFHGGGGGHRF